MKCYADTSFIGQFLVPDFATAAARAVFQRLHRPPLLFRLTPGVSSPATAAKPLWQKPQA